MKRPICNEKGVTLVELIVAMFLMVIMTYAIAEISLVTVRSMTSSAAFGIANSNARETMRRMAGDLRKAGMPAVGSAEAILSSSDASTVCITTYGENFDSFVAGSADMNDDTVCYKYCPPDNTLGGGPSSVTKYSPGFIMSARGSGGSWPIAPSCTSPTTGFYQRITSLKANIVDMEFEYCRPGKSSSHTQSATPGEFTCTNSVNGTEITSDWQCVWQIRVKMKVAKAPSPSDAATPGIPPSTPLQMSVEPRNIYLRSLNQDQDGDKIIDCCDDNNTTDSGGPREGRNVTWCPPAQG